MADKKYLVLGPEGHRVVTNPGNATVISGPGETNKFPMNWSSLAYTAGGGALGYMLSKWLMGDDEEDEKGKKKDKGLLRSLVPWLAAAAGAYGGHLLSGAELTGKGRKGEYALKMNSNGTIKVPDEPSSGKVPHKIGKWGIIGGGALLGRGGLGVAATRIPRNKARLSAMSNSTGLDRLARKVQREKIKGIIKRQVNHPYYAQTINFLGAQAPKGWWSHLTNWKGNLVLGGILSALGGGAKWLGHNMNSDLRNWREALDRAGISYGD